MLRKAICIITSVFIVQLISSCCEDFKYYDFDEMLVEVTDNQIEAADTAFFTLLAEDVEFMASGIDVGFSGAYALSCDYGWGGMRFPFTGITITSDSNFNDTLPAGTDLTSIFLYGKSLDYSGRQWANTMHNQHFIYGGLQFALADKPTESMTHRFTFQFTKSNGDLIEVESDAITWL